MKHTLQHDLPKEMIGKSYNYKNRPGRKYFQENTSGVSKVEQNHLPMDVMVEQMMVAGERLNEMKKNFARYFQSELYQTRVDINGNIKEPELDPILDITDLSDITELHRETTRRVLERRIESDKRRESIEHREAGTKNASENAGSAAGGQYDEGTGSSDTAGVQGNEKEEK